MIRWEKGYTIALRTGSSMPECERIISSIEHFHGHLEISIIWKLGLCGIEYKEDLEGMKEQIRKYILPIAKNGRRVTQLLVGIYMLVYLGIFSNENMQIEGFWYYLLIGSFEAATIHYAVAKIFGPLIFGRGWCGYACWTAMVLDFLPYKVPQSPRKKIGWIRYVMFVLSFCFVIVMILTQGTYKWEKIMFIAFLVGNLFYYVVGITLAVILKDNRAFCKYICPITVFLKPMSYFAFLRMRCDKEKCISCGKCKKACPMDVDVTDNSRKRKNGTECILCFECKKNCPKDALQIIRRYKV